MMNTFGLTIFALETLTYVYIGKTTGRPIRVGHGWITARGNLIGTIKEELIPQGLVVQTNDEFVVTSDGEEMARLILLELLKSSTSTQCSQIDQKIARLNIQRAELPIGSPHRLLIVLKIHYLRRDKIAIASKLSKRVNA